MYSAQRAENSPVPIAANLLDSAFATFQDIVNTVVGQMGIPEEFVAMLMPQIKMSVESKTGMKLDELKPVDYAKDCQCPVLFIHGCDDDFITMDHTEKNLEAYGCTDKDAIYCTGDHNAARPQETTEACIAFLKKHLKGQ